MGAMSSSIELPHFSKDNNDKLNMHTQLITRFWHEYSYINLHLSPLEVMKRKRKKEKAKKNTSTSFSVN